MESLCDARLKSALFPMEGNSPLTLEESAQIISIELNNRGLNIYEEIASKVRALELMGDNTEIARFLSKRSFNVITTNYDKLLESLAVNIDCHSITPGLPIPRSQSRVNIYHVHGSIDSPKNMVVTSDDYFKFINSGSYFSKKMSTLLHENTVVILGYSLGDTNLKAIISNYKEFSRNHVIGSNIFFVSRAKIDQYIKDYYAHSYGIRVLDQLTIHSFFKMLNASMPDAEKLMESSISNIKKVIFEGRNFKKDYLKIENAFFEIISSIAGVGISIEDPRVVTILGEVIQTKIELTKENGAWVQYEHLARWLIYLACILELKGTSIEQIYLDAALRSMNTMKQAFYTGYSWHAYTAWNNRWPGIIASNRALIRKHIEDNTSWPDALTVVRSV